MKSNKIKQLTQEKF